MIEHKYNTFWQRFWAGWIDVLVFAPLYFVDEWFFSTTHSGLITFIYYAFITSLSFYFYTVFMHGRYGQTLGKIVMKVKVFTVDGNQLGYKKAFMRDIVIIIFGICLLLLEAPEILSGTNPYDAAVHNPLFNAFMYAELTWFIAEFVTMLTNNKRRAIHDYIAGSVVYRINP